MYSSIESRPPWKMCGVSKSLSKCFTIAEHQGVEPLSFPYLQEVDPTMIFWCSVGNEGMTHNEQSSIIPFPHSLLTSKTSTVFYIAKIGFMEGISVGSLRHLHINPSGKFIIGGPQGDAGLTGRKRLGSGESAAVLVMTFLVELWHESAFLLGVIQLSVTIPIYSIIIVLYIYIYIYISIYYPILYS